MKMASELNTKLEFTEGKKLELEIKLKEVEKELDDQKKASKTKEDDFQKKSTESQAAQEKIKSELSAKILAIMRGNEENLKMQIERKEKEAKEAREEQEK